MTCDYWSEAESSPGSACSKTDDDAYTVMPNLLNHLLSLDHREPTFTGSTLGCSYRPHMYFQGLGYALSYPLVSCMASPVGKPRLTIDSSLADQIARRSEVDLPAYCRLRRSSYRLLDAFSACPPEMERCRSRQSAGTKGGRQFPQLPPSIPRAPDRSGPCGHVRKER